MSPAAAGRSAEIPGPYSVGAAPGQWPGLSGLIEEADKVMQVAGKIIATGGAAAHDGTPLRTALAAGLGDLLTAVDYVIAVNGINRAAVHEQMTRKRALYEAQRQAGREAAAQAPNGGRS